MKIQKTFEEYFRENLGKGIIDFSLRVSMDKFGTICFYIHPDGKDGETDDRTVVRNTCILRRDL